MDFQSLQNGFGTDPAKIYIFDGAIPEDNDPVEYITHQFTEDAGTNLITCVVTEIESAWVVYTKEEHQLGEQFRLLVEFPLPEPEPFVPPEVPVEEPAPETPPEQGPQ